MSISYAGQSQACRNCSVLKKSHKHYGFQARVMDLANCYGFQALNMNGSLNCIATATIILLELRTKQFLLIKKIVDYNNPKMMYK